MGRATHLPCGPGTIHKWEEAALGGCGGQCWPNYGAGDAPERLASVPGARLPLFPGPGTERKLGSDGHKPDHGAGKISTLPQTSVRARDEGKGGG